MNRREFLKLGGAASVALLLPIGLIGREIASLSTVELDGRIFHAAEDGKIYFSDNAGQTWNQLANFGPGITIFSLTIAPGKRIFTRLGFAGERFGLVYSLRENIWRTA